MNVCNLDITSINLTEQGVPSELWAWPVNYPELQDMYVSYMDGVVKCIKSAGPTDKFYDIALILSLYYGIELVDVYKSALIVEQCSKDEAEISHGGRFPIISSLVEGRPIPLKRGVLARLMNGFSGASRLRYMPKMGLNLLRTAKDSIKRKPLRMNLERDKVTCVLSEMSKAYARFSGESFYYLPVENFFPVGKQVPNELDLKGSELIQSLFEFCRELFKDFSQPVRDLVMSYFEDWLQLCCGYIDVYYTQLQSTKLIPQTVYLGTCGSIWNRILARCVISRQGDVVRFDHGAGNGFYISALQQKHFDFEDCTQFITYSRAQADIYKGSFDGKLTVLDRCPKMINFSMRDDLMRHKKIERPTRKASGKLKVMLVLNFFRGEGVNVYSREHFSDISQLDFVTRLSYKLQEWGYDILIKPHPSKLDAKDPTKKLIEHFPDQVILKPFEKVYEQADIILFFHPATTLFPVLMLSGKPLVYLDFSSMSFHKDAEQLMIKRCSFVEGRFDKENRASIDWLLLKKALIESQKKSNGEFSGTYY